MQPLTKLFSFGVDTLILNVRYADKQFQPIKQELTADLARELVSGCLLTSAGAIWRQLSWLWGVVL